MPANFSEYRQLGKSGLRLSSLGLGGWLTFGNSILDINLASEMIKTAFNAGINFFDIADVYARGESERLMGKALKDFPRHELVISSKVFWPMSDDINDRGLSRKHIMESIHKSLERIGVDYLDLYFCHRFDEHTPLLETARAMHDLVCQGKILYWGTSEWSGEQLQALWTICEKHNFCPPTVEQPQYNLLTRKRYEEDVAPACQKFGMGTVTWSPLASGVLSGKYAHGIVKGSRLDQQNWLREQLVNEASQKKVETLIALAKEAGCSPSQLAIAWILGHPAVSSVILGASNIKQLQDNLQASQINPGDSDMQKLNQIFI